MTNPHRDPKVFFEKVICEYICGDLEWFLMRKKTPPLGPVVACVGTGIDAAGGCVFGFKEDNSRQRSVKFMREYMGMTEEVAEVIYACVRCGYVREGLNSLNVSWFADDPRRLQTCVYVYRYKDEVLVDLVEVVRAYLNAIQQLWQNPSDVIDAPDRADDQEKVAALLNTELPPLPRRYSDFLNNRGNDFVNDMDMFEGIRIWPKDGYPESDD